MLRVFSLYCLLLWLLSSASYSNADPVVNDPVVKDPVAKDIVAKDIVAKDIVVKAILKNMVVIEYLGVQRTIKAGQISQEGVKLIRAATKTGAVVEINGKTQTLQLSRRVGGGSYTPPEKSVVRVLSDSRGHFLTPGRINNRPVKFLVDTGATSVALSSAVANRLGINYLEGRKVRVITASAESIGYAVYLKSVSVGNVTVNHVEAVISEGEYPKEILLGNSYLSRVEMKVDSGVLVLESRL